MYIQKGWKLTPSKIGDSKREKPGLCILQDQAVAYRLWSELCD